MTDFVLYSDIHLHSFKFASKWVVDPEHGPINSRLLDGIKVLRQIHNYALDNNIVNVVFAGDMFHIPEHTPTDVVSIVYKELEKFHKAGLQLIMIPGNHDMANKAGSEHALVPFKGIAAVASDYAQVMIGYKNDIVTLHLVPFREKKEDYLELLGQARKHAAKSKGTDILISHVGIKGAKVGADYVLNSENDLDPAALDDLDSIFSSAFFGHFHLHQPIGFNAVYIGAPMHHNWGDVGDERGFLHVTTSKQGGVGYQRILTDYPRFIVASKDSLLEDLYTENDFVKVLYEVGNKPKLPVTPAWLGFVPVHAKVEQIEVALPASMSYEQVLTTWLAHTDTVGIRKDKALKLGLELLNEAVDD